VASKRKILRFQNEAKVLSQLNHPNIAQIFDFGLSEKNVPFIAIEFVEGKTLEQILSDDGPLDVSSTLEIVSQLCAALEHAHNAGVIHRDVKPGNIMIQGSGSDVRAVLLDFGVAKLIADDTNQQITSTGYVIGSPLYMSPEQTLGKPVTQNADQYSLGCVLFAMLSGNPPFVGQTPLETCTLHREAPPPSLSKLCKFELPSGLEQILERLLAKTEAGRYSSVASLAKELARLDLGIQSAPASVAAPTPVLSKEPSSNKSATQNIAAFALFELFIAIGCILALTLLLVSFITQTRAPNAKQVMKPKELILNEDPKELTDKFMEAKITAILKEKRWQANLVGATQNELKRLIGFKHLKSVTFRHWETTDKDLAYLSASKLISLDMKGTNITTLTNVSKQTLLQELTLSKTKVPATELRKLEQLPMLKILDLEGTGLTIDDLQILTKFPSLKVVTLPRGLDRAKVEKLREKMPWCAFPQDFPGPILDTLEVKAFRAQGPQKVEILKRCLHIAEQAQGKDAIAAAYYLIRLEEVYLQQGRKEDATKCLNRAMEIARKRNQLAVVSSCLMHEGQGAILSGQLDKAEKSFREALAIEREIFNPAGTEVSTTLLNLSLVEREHAHFDKAIALAEEGLRLKRKDLSSSTARKQFANLQSALASSYYRAGNRTKAQQLFRQDLAYRQSANLYACAETILTLTSLADTSDDQQSKKKYYIDAIDLMNKIGHQDRVFLCDTYAKLYVSCINAKDYSDAIVFARRAFDEAYKPPEIQDHREILYGNDLIACLKKLNRKSEADQISKLVRKRRAQLKM
ncbi:MAG: serine/threonine-protein kinase, partial [Cyanobacteria bacterium]|nr:serine/threonine-protein kinase [Cyanobacteriota bacterium]